MSVVATAADASAALNRILRGNYQQAADAWAGIEPKLSSFADGLAAAIRRDEVELMAFEYKRVEAFNRGIGALLNRIAAALEDLEAIAGEPEFATVQVRAAGYVHALGAMKKTLTRKLQLVNRLQAQAAKAIKQSRERSAEYDADWERLQDQAERTLQSFESLHQRMTRLRSELKAAQPLTLPMAETGEEDAKKLVGAAPTATLERLRRDVARLDDAIVVETTSKAFAVQFRKERPKLEQQFERMASVSAFLKDTAWEIRRAKIDLRRSPPR
jgi:hypothetical protein